MASISVLHTGITSGCAQCHGGATALTFYNNNDNPKAAASLSPAHIPAFTGEDCSSCHTPNYAAGGFGPMNMTQATHAGVGTTCNTCHEAGLSFYMGAASPGLQGRPADHTGGPAGRAERLQPLPHAPPTGTPRCCPRATCRTRPTRPAMSATPRRPRNYTTLAANSRAAYRHQQRAARQCHGGTQRSRSTTISRPKDAVLAPAHIPYLPGHRLRFLPQVEHLRRRQLRADEHDPGHARVRHRPPAIPAMRRA